MNCKFCNQEISVTDKFCPHCGSNLQTSNENTETEQQRNSSISHAQKVCKSCNSIISADTLICPVCKQWAHIAPAPKSNGMAIAAFICSFFIPLLGWIFGGVGLARSKERSDKGRGLSIAAVVIATISFLINLSLLT